ncbi:hypothetical protein BC835DRAFT_361407 [Cytidiella melzeri]|nr:hypothetical protein BC835DRAFT_361407 [Cytidiella melzeri]
MNNGARSLEMGMGQGKAAPLSQSDTMSVRSYHEYEKLPFFGPPDPTRWPLHKKCFFGGLLFPPLWLLGAFLPVRDPSDNWAELFRLRCVAIVMIIFIVVVALVILETAFKNS